jgi:hypothetical protein
LNIVSFPKDCERILFYCNINPLPYTDFFTLTRILEIIMSLTHKKAQTLARSLADSLAVRLPLLVVTAGTDASGNPTVTINDGTPATTEQNLFLRVLEMPSLGLDSLGNAQQSYGPHVIQLAMETSTLAGVGFPTDANRLMVMGEVLQLSTRVEVYLEANGTVPSVSSLVAGNLVATFENLRFAPMANV